MEFVVKKSDLFRELSAVQSATERKTTIPILTNVLLKAENGLLYIAATDLDCSLRTTCPAAIAKEGTITLPARKLYEHPRTQCVADRCRVIQLGQISPTNSKAATAALIASAPVRAAVQGYVFGRIDDAIAGEIENWS